MKKHPEDYLDPIAIERRIRERDEFVENLFHPVFWGGPNYRLDWLVQDLIPIGYLVMLAGPPKSGKTCLATALGIAVANGLPFAGRPVHQGGVLWISAEESPRERQIFLKGSRLVEPSTPLYTCYRRLSVTEEQTLEGIRDWVIRTGARLLVVDPLIACAGHSLTDSWAARRSLQELKTFAEMQRITVLVIHHQKRDIHSYRRSRVADNAQLAATASMNIVLSHSSVILGEGPRSGSKDLRTHHSDTSVILSEGPVSRSKDLRTHHHPNSDKRCAPDTRNVRARLSGSEVPPRLLTLDCYGRGAFANNTIYLVSKGPLDFRPTHVEETSPIVESEHLRNIERDILGVLRNGPRGSARIIEESRLNEGSVRNAITNLRKKGRIKMINVGKNKRIYALNEPLKDEDMNLNENERPCEQPSEQPCEPPTPIHEVKK